MSSSAEELARRREQLIARCETQRADIALHVSGLAMPIKLADRVINAGRYLRRHPLASGAAVAAVVVTQRHSLMKWGQRVLVAWRVVRALRAGRNAF